VGSLQSSLAWTGASASRATALAVQRRAVGRVAGVVISLGALAALATMQLLRDPRVPSAFYLVIALGLVTGIGCVLVRWDRVSARWLHALPVIATLEVALGVRVGGVYGDIAGNYYVFVGVFAAYAFSDRRAIVAHVAFAAAVSILPLFYLHSEGGEVAGRAIVGVLMLVVIAAFVTLLRERLETRQRELEELTVRDPMTGVGNYRLLAERLDYELARHRRSGGSLTVMLLDLDGFKEINDTFGHLVGDRVLIEVARALLSTVREQDTLARQGGDEFSILAPESGEEHAAQLATRVQDAVSTATRGSLTTSVGWAIYPDHGKDPSALLALADADLRHAKPAYGAGRRERAAKPWPDGLRSVERSGG
jgi:diguanylate cyclase (GGDEF)-like protein